MRKEELAAALLRQLDARDAADSRIAAELMRAADLLNKAPDASGLPAAPLERELFISLHSLRMSLLRQIRFNEELLWYETKAESCLRSRKVYALSPVIREFCSEIELLASGYVEMTVDDVPETLCSAIPPQRLSFVMLCLLTESLAQSPAYNSFRFTAAEEEGRIRISLCFCEGTNPEKKNLPEPAWAPAVNAELPAAPQQIIRRFTEMFDVRILRQETDRQHLYSLSFPSVLPVDTVGTFGSDRAHLPECPVSVYHAMLEAVIPAEELLLFDTRRL